MRKEALLRNPPETMENLNGDEWLRAAQDGSPVLVVLSELSRSPHERSDMRVKRNPDFASLIRATELYRGCRSCIAFAAPCPLACRNLLDAESIR
jgi:hypothetical protein